MTIQVVVLTQYSPARPCSRIQLPTNTSWIDVTQKLCQCRHRSMYELVASQCCLSLRGLPLVTVNSGLKWSVGGNGRISTSNSTTETSLKVRHYHAVPCVAVLISTDSSWMIFSSHFCTFFIEIRNVILCRPTDEISQKNGGNLQACKFRVSIILYLHRAVNNVTQSANQHMHTFNFFLLKLI